LFLPTIFIFQFLAICILSQIFHYLSKSSCLEQDGSTRYKKWFSEIIDDIKKKGKSWQEIEKDIFLWKIKEIGDILNIDLYQMEMILEE
jgi:hypothetical protein